ncbi:hypothetical protein LSAT2_001141 [Lamellibrachia satsuma]|nr:hypothetical protein LSAT2_001141 [Lamellibrachia satsuma]
MQLRRQTVSFTGRRSRSKSTTFADRNTRDAWSLGEMLPTKLLRCACLFVFVVSSLASVVRPTETGVVSDLCGFGTDGLCAKNVNAVPPEVLEVCEACGNYWGNLPGFAYCCRCSDKIFAFCLEAVLGGTQDSHADVYGRYLEK